MNKIQRIILILGAVIFLAAGLFPPWKRVYAPMRLKNYERPAGRRFIKSPPDPGDSAMLENVTTKLDTTMLSLELGGIVTLTLLLYASAARLHRNE